MRCVLAAPPAVLLELQPIGVRATILGRRVVPPLTRRARERDDVAHRLLRDLPGDARAHGPPAFPDREPQLLLHRHRHDQLDRHRHVVPRHHHLHPLGQRAHPRHVRRPKVELRPVPVEVRRVPPPLFLRPHGDFRFELLVRCYRPRLRRHLPPLRFVLFNSPQQLPHIVPPPPPLPHPAQPLPPPL